MGLRRVSVFRADRRLIHPAWLTVSTAVVANSDVHRLAAPMTAGAGALGLWK